MKKLLIIVALLVIPTMCFAASTKDSGNKKLNRYLEEISFDVHEGRLSQTELKSHIQESFGLKPVDFKQIKRRKLDPGESYLIGLIHKATKAKTTRIIGRYRQGKRSWKDVIYYCGTSPDDLNAMRVTDQKKWKKERRRAGKKSKRPKGTIASAKKVTMSDKGEKWECMCRQK
jgi:hypothetical protein